MKSPVQPLTRDLQGVLRFKSNALVGPKPGTPYKCYHGLGFNCKTCWPTAEPTRPAVWPFKNYPGKVAPRGALQRAATANLPPV